MTKPNFQEMSRKELKKYILAHPTDDEALEELFITRHDSNAIRIPNDMPHEQVEVIFKAAITKADDKSNQISQ